MDTWPSDGRKQVSPSSRNQPKASRRGAVWDYPVVQEGSVNAISLKDHNGRLEWDSIVNIGQVRKAVPKRTTVKLFPQTCSPPSQILNIPASQHAQQGAQFIRTHFPDVDIPSEIIREHVEIETRWSRSLAVFDPLKGNVIESVQCPNSSSGELATCLVFPMGESGTQLSVSPLDYCDGNGITTPIASPAWTFSTPIYQIVTASARNDHQKAMMAVRTLSSTSTFEVELSRPLGTSGPSARLTKVYDISRSDVGDRHVVDIKSFVDRQAILVNDRGEVYKLHRGKPMKMHTPPAEETAKSVIWRLASTLSSDGCLLASESLLRQLDFRSDTPSLELFSPRHPGELLVCLEDAHSDGLFRFATTTWVVWIDARSPRKPLLAYKHGRQFDQTLSVGTIFLPTPLTFLTSKKSGLITVYDVSRANSRECIHVNSNPYCLPPVSGSYGPHQGHVFLKYPSGTDFSVVQLSERGGIHALDFAISTGPEHQGIPPADVGGLDPILNSRTDPGPAELRESKKADLSLAYAYISRDLHADPYDDDLGVSSQDIHTTLERMPQFWQEVGRPLQCLLTTADIAAASAHGSVTIPEGSFTCEPTNRTAAFRAFSQDHVCISRLVQEAPWHHNIIPTLRHFDKTISSDPQAIIDAVQGYNTIDAPNSKVQAAACELLALDLVLSLDVFAPHPFNRAAGGSSLDTLETMSRATAALSLSNKPPPIQFGYLRPVAKSTQAGSSSQAEVLPLPIGARLLLKDWSVGTDPHQYVYRDEGPSRDMVPASTRRPATQNTRRAEASQVTQPPTIVDSGLKKPPTLRPGSPRRAPMRFQSEGPTTALPMPAARIIDGSQSSQTMMSHTQVLPGLYGGRQKKVGKKRLDGF